MFWNHLWNLCTATTIGSAIIAAIAKYQSISAIATPDIAVFDYKL